MNNFEEKKDKNNNTKLLTSKQEKFCYLIAIENMNHSDAYRQSYSSTTDKKETINNLAYKLIKKVEIRARINELRKEADEMVYYSTIDYIKTIDFLIEKALNKKEKKEIIIDIEEGQDLFGNPIYKKVKKIEEVDKTGIKEARQLIELRAKITGKFKENENTNNIALSGDIIFNLDQKESDRNKIIDEINNIVNLKEEIDNE